MYDNAVKNKGYKIGDLVGLQINRVDRTNTTPKILPCKVASLETSADGHAAYRVCTVKGFLSVPYGVQDLLDLTGCHFADLRVMDPAILPTLTFIQACREYVSVGNIVLAEACHCNGKWATKACPCVAKGIQCGTKCHPRKKHACANVQ